MPKAWRGYSYTGASVMSSWLGRKDDAVDLLQQFLDKPKIVLPNTMYIEAGPVIETPFGLTKAEVRIMFIWVDEPVPVMTIIRMGRGLMMGVDHNKDMEWVGSSAGFYR